MKRAICIMVTLLAMSQNGLAQKFLDIYRMGYIVSSLRTADIDSMVIGNYANNQTVNFYEGDRLFHRTLSKFIDSIKVFRAEDEPLVYMGIVGFNQELYEKPIAVLQESTASNFNGFISGLTRKDGTLLYYGVDRALDVLKDYTFPTNFVSVNLVTFTDGLDQGSLMMNGSYSTDEQYLNAVSNRIATTSIKGVPLTAYSLGLRGSDVTNYTLFQNNLNKLASSSDKAFEVNSMSAVRSKLQEISDQIISISNKQTISMRIPGQSNGTLVRFTFDGYSAENSSLYIEGTFNLSDRSLRNVSYHGIKAESGSFIQGKQDGIFVTYTFSGLQRIDGNGLIPTSNIRQYYKSESATTWQVNSEFTPDNNTQTTIAHSGAVIMLVLDCSSSLGSQFSDMLSYAKDFVNRVASNAATNTLWWRPFGRSIAPLFSDYLWMPSEGNGWSHSTCPILVSEDGEFFSGYAYMKNGEFKFTPDGNWDAEYNNGSFTTYDNTLFDMGDGGGGNINFVGAPGMYFFTVNLAEKSVTATPVTWSVIGGFNNWDADEVMSYDEGNHCLSVTINFTEATEWKFRRDYDWDVNYGGTPAALVRDGGNLNVAAGTYTIQLFIERPAQDGLYAKLYLHP